MRAQYSCSHADRLHLNRDENRKDVPHKFHVAAADRESHQTLHHSMRDVICQGIASRGPITAKALLEEDAED